MFYRFDGRQPTKGKGTYVSTTAIVVGDVRLGNDCYIGHGVILRGDYGSIEIGDGTAVEEGAIVHAAPRQTCRLGNRVTIGHGAIVHAGEVGDSVVVGMGAVVSIGAEVGTTSIVAEGAVVRRGQEVPESVVVAGNPARKVRDVLKRDRDFWDAAKDVYIELAHKYLEQGMEMVSPD